MFKPDKHIGVIINGAIESYCNKSNSSISSMTKGVSNIVRAAYRDSSATVNNTNVRRTHFVSELKA